jgi:predicted O-methyltransferase YrrM
MNAKQTVEIGIGRGYCSFALGLYAEQFKGRHTVVDWREEQRAVADKLNQNYSLNIEYIQANARTYQWQGKAIDLLFIDILGNEDVFLDVFSRFAGVVKRNGLIIVHDYYCFASIQKAVDLFFRGGRNGYEVLTIPADGEPRMQPELEGPCGMAIVRKL